MNAIQESLWIDQLSQLMQLDGRVADFMDIQGSSVLVLLGEWLGYYYTGKCKNKKNCRRSRDGSTKI